MDARNSSAAANRRHRAMATAVALAAEAGAACSGLAPRRAHGSSGHVAKRAGAVCALGIGSAG
jgi:hypothetical protein